MFNSLDVRVPYLENDFLDFAFGQASNKQVGIFETKKMLKV